MAVCGMPYWLTLGLHLKSNEIDEQGISLQKHVGGVDHWLRQKLTVNESPPFPRMGRLGEATIQAIIMAKYKGANGQKLTLRETNEESESDPPCKAACANTVCTSGLRFTLGWTRWCKREQS